LSRRLGVAACVIAAATLLHAPGAAADHSVIEWVSHGAPPGEPVGVGYSAHSSPDGSSVVYITGGRLVPQDTDSALDLYEWTDGVNELLSIGPAGGNAEVSVEDEIAASRDLSRVLFITEEGLVPEDTDRARDLYEHAGGATRLLTNGGVPFEGRGLYHSTPRVNYVTPDGSHVFFTTRDPLVPEDTAEDSALIEDVYVRSQGVTRLVTAYPDGGNAIGSFGGATTNGSRAWFNASLPLVPEDQDGYEYDVYERSGGTTTLVSRGISGNTFFAGASADGSRIFITAGGQLTPDDPDASADVYELTPSGPVLITTGPADDATGAPMRVHYVSPDGARVLFATAERLFSDLPRGGYLYERSGGTTKVISGPPIDGRGPDCYDPVGDQTYCSLLDKVAGNKVFHTTTGRLVAEDTDADYDSYVYSGGVNRLVGGANAYFSGASSDGARAFVTTPDQLLPADTDTLRDVYENHDGTLSLVTYYPSADPWGTISVPAVADDGDVFFTTSAAVAGAPGGSTNLFVARVADQTGYPRPRSTRPMKVSLVPAYSQCATGAANRTHGPPLASPSCAPPAARSSLLTVGTPDANGQPPKSVGHVGVEPLIGDPAPADEADIRLTAFEQDIRRASDLADYTGELQARLGLRITERDGPTPAGGGPAPVTQQDVSLSFTVPCSPTPDTSVGATCSTTTTADAVAPGVVVERRRAIWELRHVQVLDGGPDGDAETISGNHVFQVPGVFIP